METKKKILLILVLALALLVWPAEVSKASPLGTAFTFQSRLIDANNAADGIYDFAFKIYDANVAGTQKGSTINIGEVDVIDGYFTVSLDFGSDVFDGNARWLEVGVRAGELKDPNVYTVLFPRQQVAPTPYALYADMLDGLHASSFLSTGSDYGRSGVSSNLYEGTTALTDKYVNQSGDTMTGSTSGNVLNVTNSYAGDGRAIYGEATNTGNYQNYGGYFSSAGLYGMGVRGVASNSGDHTNYGGFFQAAGLYGYGVYGEAAGDHGDGVHGEATGGYGRGVYGLARNYGNYTNYGGYFESAGTSGMGVYGLASNNWGGNYQNFGGYFEAAGTYGRGVYGKASNSGNYENYGGYFQAAGSGGQGVHGDAAGSNGRGVFGEASSSGNVLNYGGFFTAAGSDGRGVYGEASNNGDYTNYGGYFLAAGSTGHGVQGWAIGNTGVGVHGLATGPYGIGVYGFAATPLPTTNYGGYFVASGLYGVGVRGSGQLFDFYAAGPGTNYGPFTGGHEVKLSDDFPANIRPGMIVSVTGETQVRRDDDGKISISSTLPTVKLCDVANDKAVFGVFVAEGPLPKDHWYRAKESERFATVNALGEGRVWVCDINGKVEVGDYITTSPVPGYGQKQYDNLLRSCTLGKATESVDWDSVTETIEFGGRIYKVYLIAVVYTSG